METQNHSASKFQKRSLFTLKIYFKDRNSVAFHSWKQETLDNRTGLRAQHRYAFERLEALIQKHSGKYITAVIYCNSSNRQLLKFVNGREEQRAQLKYRTTGTGEIVLQSLLLETITGTEELIYDREIMQLHVQANKEFKLQYNKLEAK